MIIKNLLMIIVCTLLASGALAAEAQVDLSQVRVLPFESSDKILLENVKFGGERYAVIMQFDANYALIPIWSSPLNTVTIPHRSITIDGESSDWLGLSPAIIDPAGDEELQYATMTGTDLAEVYLARDDTYLYFLMIMHDGDPIQIPQTFYVVEFQQYLAQLHTPGDLFAMVSFLPDDGWTVQVQDRGPGSSVEQYPSDYVGIGASRLEFKVPITGMQFPQHTPEPYFSPSEIYQGIENQYVRVYIHPLLTDPPPPLSDTNDDLSRPMIVDFY